MRMLNPVYLPFIRAFVEGVDVVSGGKGIGGSSTGLKSMSGSGRPILNPLEAMISQATTMIAKAQKLRIGKA